MPSALKQQETREKRIVRAKPAGVRRAATPLAAMVMTTFGSGAWALDLKVLAATGDMETVAQLLGYTSIDCSQRYVDVDQNTLQAMFAGAV